MPKKIILACLLMLGELAFAQQVPVNTTDTDSAETTQQTIILRRESQPGKPPVDKKVTVPVDRQPIIIVLPQQQRPQVTIQDQRQEVHQITPPAAPLPAAPTQPAVIPAEDSRPVFFVGVEGGKSFAHLPSSSLRNWEYGYRWNQSNSAVSSVMRAYVGYKINPHISAETGLFATNKIKGSRHNRTAFNYDTYIKMSGFDFLVRYTTTENVPGFYMKAGYGYVERVGASYVAYNPDNVPSGQMRWTHGTESAMHVALGAGYELSLGKNLGLTLTSMYYRTVFSNEKSRMLFLMGGVKYNF